MLENRDDCIRNKPLKGFTGIRIQLLSINRADAALAGTETDLHIPE